MADDIKLTCPLCDGNMDLRRLGKKPLFRCVGKGDLRGCGLKFEPAGLSVDEAIERWERFCEKR